jgi:cell division protein FtsQ
VLVHLGSSDYLRRYKIYVTHAQGWRQQFQKLESVDLRYDNQIIVNPEIQRTAKQTALSPAAAKVAAAAGVKPAALITRLPPHDRAVPKPAFELTEKKLDPKAAVGGMKKPAPKPKVTKTTAKGKAAAGWKKKPATAKPATSIAAKKPSGTSGGQKPSPAVAKTQSQGLGR